MEERVSQNETRRGSVVEDRMGDRMVDQAASGVVASWDDIPGEQVREGVRRRAFGNADMILVLNDIEPKMQPSPHRHDDFDQIATILKGRAIYHIGAVGHEVGPGSLLLIPAGVEHWIEPVGDEPVENLDVFAPARADYAHLLTWMPRGTRDESPE